MRCDKTHHRLLSRHSRVVSVQATPKGKPFRGFPPKSASCLSSGFRVFPPKAELFRGFPQKVQVAFSPVLPLDGKTRWKRRHGLRKLDVVFFAAVLRAVRTFEASGLGERARLGLGQLEMDQVQNLKWISSLVFSLVSLGSFCSEFQELEPPSGLALEVSFWVSQRVPRQIHSQRRTRYVLGAPLFWGPTSYFLVAWIGLPIFYGFRALQLYERFHPALGVVKFADRWFRGLNPSC